MKLRYSWTEIAILLATAIIIGRYIWAKELLIAENSFLESMDIPAYTKYFLTVPIALFVFYRIYEREAVKARVNGKPIVSKSVAIFSIAGFSAAVIYMVFYV
jgi:hypothetical protein